MSEKSKRVYTRVTQEDEKKIKVGWIGCLGDVALWLHFDKILVG